MSKKFFQKVKRETKKIFILGLAMSIIMGNLSPHMVYASNIDNETEVEQNVEPQNNATTPSWNGEYSVLVTSPVTYLLTSDGHFFKSSYKYNGTTYYEGMFDSDSKKLLYNQSLSGGKWAEVYPNVIFTDYYKFSNAFILFDETGKAYHSNGNNDLDFTKDDISKVDTINGRIYLTDGTILNSSNLTTASSHISTSLGYVYYASSYSYINGYIHCYDNIAEYYKKPKGGSLSLVSTYTFDSDIVYTSFTSSGTNNVNHDVFFYLADGTIKKISVTNNTYSVSAVDSGTYETLSGYEGIYGLNSSGYLADITGSVYGSVEYPYLKDSIKVDTDGNVYGGVGTLSSEDATLPVANLAHICTYNSANVSFTQTDLENDTTKTFTCTCGKEYDINATEADEISFDSQYIATKEPTCTTGGTYVLYSAVSNKKLGSYDVSALGHDYDTSTKINVVEPTCLDYGSYDYACTRCDSLDHHIGEEPKGHSYGDDYSRIEEGSCTEDTYKYKLCTECGKEVEVEHIVAPGHTLTTDYAVTSEATCIKEGKKYKVCTTCGEIDEDSVVITPKSNHTYVVTNGTATCTKGGKATLECTICGATYSDSYIEALGHEYNSEVTKAPTCKETGIETYTCIRCGDSYEEELPIVDHSYSSEITTPATCTSEGVETFTCDTCSNSYTKPISVLGHNYTVTITKTASATEEGSLHYLCERCNLEYDVTTAKTNGMTVHAGAKRVLIHDAETGHMYFTGPNLVHLEGPTVSIEETRDDEYGTRQIRMAATDQGVVNYGTDTFSYGIPKETSWATNTLDKVITIDDGKAKEWIFSSSCQYLSDKKIIPSSHSFPNGIQTYVPNGVMDTSTGTDYLLFVDNNGNLYTVNTYFHTCDKTGGINLNIGRTYHTGDNELPFSDVSSMEKNAAALCENGKVAVISTQFIQDDIDLYYYLRDEKGIHGLSDSEFHKPVIKYTDNKVNFVAVSAGSYRTYAIDTNGHLRQIHEDASYSAPLNDTVYTKISSGKGHYLALDINGNIWAWGDNEWNQCGDGSFEDIDLPKQITNGTYFTDISAGYEFSAAVDTDKNYYAFGHNNYNQCGVLKETVNTVDTPTIMFNLSHVHYYSNTDYELVKTPSCENEGYIKRTCAECGNVEELYTKAQNHDYIEPYNVYKHYVDYKKDISDAPIYAYSPVETYSVKTYLNAPDVFTVDVTIGDTTHIVGFTYDKDAILFNQIIDSNGSVSELDSGEVNNSYTLFSSTDEKEKYDFFYGSYYDIYSYSSDGNAITDLIVSDSTATTEAEIARDAAIAIYEDAVEKFNCKQSCATAHQERRICKYCYDPIYIDVEAGDHIISALGDKVSKEGYIQWPCASCGEIIKEEPIVYNIRTTLSPIVSTSSSGVNHVYNQSTYGKYAEYEQLSVSLKYGEEYILPMEGSNSGTFTVDLGPFETEDGNHTVIGTNELVAYVDLINNKTYQPGDTIKNLTAKENYTIPIRVIYKTTIPLTDTVKYKDSIYNVSSYDIGVNGYTGLYYRYSYSALEHLASNSVTTGKQVYAPNHTFYAYPKSRYCTSGIDLYQQDIDAENSSLDYGTTSSTGKYSSVIGYVFESIDEFEEAYPDADLTFTTNNPKTLEIYIDPSSTASYRTSTNYEDVVMTGNKKVNGYDVYIIPGIGYDKFPLYKQYGVSSVSTWSNETNIYLKKWDSNIQFVLHDTLNGTETITNKIEDIPRYILNDDETMVLSTWSYDENGRKDFFTSSKTIEGTMHLYAQWIPVGEDAIVANFGTPQFVTNDNIDSMTEFSSEDLLLVGEKELNTVQKTLYGIDSTKTSVSIDTDSSELETLFDKHVRGAKEISGLTELDSKPIFIKNGINSSLYLTRYNDESTKVKIGSHDVIKYDTYAFFTKGTDVVTGEIVLDLYDNKIKLLYNDKLYTPKFVYDNHTTIDSLQYFEFISETGYVYVSEDNNLEPIYYNADNDNFVDKDGKVLDNGIRCYPVDEIYTIKQDIPESVVVLHTDEWCDGVNADILLKTTDTSLLCNEEGGKYVVNTYEPEILEDIYLSYLRNHLLGIVDLNYFAEAFLLRQISLGEDITELLESKSFSLISFPTENELKQRQMFVEKYLIDNSSTSLYGETKITLEPQIISLDTYSETAYEFQDTSISAEALKKPEDSEWHVKYEADSSVKPVTFNFLNEYSNGYNSNSFKTDLDYWGMIRPEIDTGINQRIETHIESFSLENTEALNDLTIYLRDYNGNMTDITKTAGVEIKESESKFKVLNGEKIKKVVQTYGYDDAAFMVLTEEGHIWVCGGYSYYTPASADVLGQGSAYLYANAYDNVSFYQLAKGVEFKDFYYDYNALFALDSDGNLWTSQDPRNTVEVGAGFHKVSQGVVFNKIGVNDYYNSEAISLIDSDGNIWIYCTQTNNTSHSNYFIYGMCNTASANYVRLEKDLNGATTTINSLGATLVQLTSGTVFKDVGMEISSGNGVVAIDVNGNMWIGGYTAGLPGYSHNGVYTSYDTDAMTCCNYYSIPYMRKLTDLYPGMFDGIKWKSIEDARRYRTDYDSKLGFIDENNRLWECFDFTLGYFVTEHNVKDGAGMFVLDTDDKLHIRRGKQKNELTYANSLILEDYTFDEIGSWNNRYFLTNDGEYIFFRNYEGNDLSSSNAYYSHCRPETYFYLDIYYHHYGSASSDGIYSAENGTIPVTKGLYLSYLPDIEIEYYKLKKGQPVGYTKGFDVSIDTTDLFKIDGINMLNGDSIFIDANPTKDTVFKIISADTYNYGTVNKFLTDENRTEEQTKSETQITQNTLDIERVTSDMDGAIYFLKSNYAADKTDYYSDSIKLDVVPLKSLKAEYTGEPVAIGAQAKPEDIALTLEYEDGKTYDITYDDLTETPDSLGISTANNEFALSFETASTTVEIPGINGIVSLIATYPESVFVGEEFDPNKVEITATYSDNTTSKLTYDFADVDKEIKNIGNNTYTVKAGSAETSLIIQGYYYDKLTAVYNGTDIDVGKEYKKEDVEVTLSYTDNNVNAVPRVLTIDEWTENSLTVSKSGNNEFIASLVADANIKGTYTVNGLNTIESLTASYMGPDINVGADYDKDDVVVKAKYSLSDEYVTIPSDEWTESSLTVTQIDENIFTASFEGLTANYTVNGIGKIGLSAVYKGEDVYTGNSYNKDDVEVKLNYSDGTSKVIPSDEWTEDKLIVERDGENKFTASYDGEEDEFTIIGYSEDSIEALYQGTNVFVGNNYEKEDVLVKVIYTNNTSEALTPDEWTENSLLVTQVGENEFTATYKTLTDTFKVIGYQCTGIEATYNGDDIKVGNRYNKDDVEVLAIYSDNTKEKIDTDKWEASSLFVSQDGNNEYTATFNGFETDYVVIGYTEKEIEAIYKGEPVPIDKEYNKDDVEVKLWYTNDTYDLIDSDKWEESGLTVEKEGTNEFTATYKDFVDEFEIIGYDDTIIPTGLKATYPESVLVGQEFDENKVVIEVTYNNNTTSQLKYDLLTVKAKDKTVKQVGNNTYFLEYEGIKTNLIVDGYTIESIEAEYVGPKIVVGNDYKKEDVKVTVNYTKNIQNKTSEIVTDFSVDSLRVTQQGNNYYKAVYKGHTDNYTVVGVLNTTATTTDTTNTNTTNEKTTLKDKVTSYVQTGDAGMIGFYILCMIASATVLFIIWKNRKKNN